MTPASRGSADARSDDARARMAVTSWPDAAAAAFEALADDLDKHAEKILKKPEADPIHDMRTRTRRLRTAATIYRSAFPNRQLRRLERELRRVARRLGAARDLDVMLETLGDGEADGGDQEDPTNPLRKAWTKERQRTVDRLETELARGRFRRSLERAGRLAEQARTATDGGPDGSDPQAPVVLVAHRAPSTIWKSFGEVLAYDLDPRTADADEIHEMRIAAKGFRYTLEAFEDTVDRGLSTLIEQVTGLQDAAGEMHDAIVAAQRARTFAGGAVLSEAERAAIEQFATEQDARAEALRPTIRRRLVTVQGSAFRRSLGNAIVHMAGKGSPVSG